MNRELIKKTSSFPASFGLYLSKLCQMAIENNDNQNITTVKKFIDEMIQKYGKIIRKNNRLSWNKRQLLGRNPCLYARLKKMRGA